MLREVAHFLLHAPVTLAMKLVMDRTRAHEILTDRFDRAGFAAKRRKVVEDLSGSVLEVGCGIGTQFFHYPAEARVLAVEPDDSRLGRAHLSSLGARARIEVIRGSAETLPHPDGVFDAIVLITVLCSVSSAATVLFELRRVLRPEGELRLIEHGRSARSGVAFLMDMANPVWRMLNRNGCNLNRDPVGLLQSTGFVVHNVEEFQIFCPGLPAFPMKMIRAKRGDADVLPHHEHREDTVSALVAREQV